ncbi:MAG: methyltransferase [Desulfovibrionaceae bacterium]|nr:methyltransferase [Desulfovibrionaceae bacterium]
MVRKKDFDLNAPLDDLLHEARRRFKKVRFDRLAVGGVELDLLQVEDMSAYLDGLVGRAGSGRSVDLPLWAKVWPACFVLAMFLGRIPAEAARPMLEIGTGIGLVGLCVATKGHQVVLSDIDPDALLFSRINVLKNGLAAKASVLRADFTSDRLQKSFQRIVGCEVLYGEKNYPGMIEFLSAHLSEDPEAEVVLAQDMRRPGAEFLRLAQERFQVARKEVPCTWSASERRPVVLYRMRRR